MVGIGRDLWRSSSPTPLLEQDHLEHVAQDRVQAGFEYLQRRRLHSLSGQPVPVLGHPQSKEVFSHVQMELPVFQFVPIAPCPVAGHHLKESGDLRFSSDFTTWSMLIQLTLKLNRIHLYCSTLS